MPDFSLINVSQAGVDITNGTYLWTGMSQLRPAYTLPKQDPLPDILLTWVPSPNPGWCLTLDGFPAWSHAFYNTITHTDWCYEFFQATWQLGPHPDTSLPLPLLQPVTRPDRPTTTALLTAAQLTLAHISTLPPTFTWTYLPGNGGPPQDAYHIQAASSPLLLNAHLPDLWDSGIVESPDHQPTYAGEELADLQTYFWAVRVRDTSGVWSEDW